ncbi:MAG: ATP-binding cassette domain-containing protein [Desulfovibrionales bacterium]
MSPTLYDLVDVRQVYGDREVLSIPSLHIEDNTILGLTGPNGSGKSTLMRILALLESPFQGKVMFNGKEATPHNHSLRRKVTMLGQDPYLFKRSVFANVSFGLKIRGESDIRPKVNLALEMVGLDPLRFASRTWAELSGGEARRVALAARLALRPKVLLLDEPTASLDGESTDLVKAAALRARAEWNTALVIISHDLPWLSAIADKTLSLLNGELTENVFRTEQRDFA